jgi:hypothetical protein
VDVNHDGYAFDVDVFGAAGGAAKPYVLEFETAVTGGVVAVSFAPRLKEAMVNAIEILPAPERMPLPFHFRKIEQTEAGSLLQGVKWRADAAWTLNSHHPEVGNLSSGEMWSSYGGDDRKIGRILSEPLVTTPAGCIVVPVAHGPSIENITLTLLAGQRVLTVPLVEGNGRWQFYEFRSDHTLPLRILAMDNGIGYGQWLAVGQPRSCK